MSGTMDVVIASGVESMTRVPMGLSVTLAAKEGFGIPKSPRMEERYPNIQFSQFMGAEMVAEKYGLTKDQLDEFGFHSHQRAIAATQGGAFKDEILALDGLDKKGALVRHDSDEGIRYDVSLEGMRAVKLLQEGGRITAATSSQICDGASGVMIVSERALKEHNLTPMARIHHLSLLGHDPVIMLEAPIPATERALKSAGISVDDIDLYEGNEAFASVPVAFIQKLQVDPERINVNGGGIALRQPPGGPGPQPMATPPYVLHGRRQQHGLRSIGAG